MHACLGLSKFSASEIRTKSDLCPLKFKTKEELEQHRLYHSHKVVSACDVCTRVFWFKKGLKEHKKAEHKTPASYVVKSSKKRGVAASRGLAGAAQAAVRLLQERQAPTMTTSSDMASATEAARRMLNVQQPPGAMGLVFTGNSMMDGARR